MRHKIFVLLFSSLLGFVGCAQMAENKTTDLDQIIQKLNTSNSNKQTMDAWGELLRSIGQKKEQCFIRISETEAGEDNFSMVKAEGVKDLYTFTVCYSNEGLLSFNGNQVAISDLDDQLYDYVQSAENGKIPVRKNKVFIEPTGEIDAAEIVFRLTSQELESLSAEKIQSVHTAFTKAIMNLREIKSKEIFDKEYSALSPDQKSDIMRVVPKIVEVGLNIPCQKVVSPKPAENNPIEIE